MNDKLKKAVADIRSGRAELLTRAVEEGFDYVYACFWREGAYSLCEKGSVAYEKMYVCTLAELDAALLAADEEEFNKGEAK